MASKPTTEHPRARGENAGRNYRTEPRGGTSPRTRGKLQDYLKVVNNRRNIPAHAGKTLQLRPRGERAAEHPRARGENVSIAEPFSRGNGTSPRTRGKPSTVPMRNWRRRNIPAHAGKTGYDGSIIHSAEEHPRARGENLRRVGVKNPLVGTSPRTRGKPMIPWRYRHHQRNIPAHAGKTPLLWGLSGTSPEHPRARGENRNL